MLKNLSSAAVVIGALRVKPKGLTLPSHLLITFANSLDPDQARQNLVSGLDPNCLML